MSSEPMELAKNWDETKAAKVLPGYAQIKYDGVPLTFIRMPKEGVFEGKVVALTRQNEVVTSVPHLLAHAEMLLLSPGASFTGECLVPGMPFKDSSGIIRRMTPDEETAQIICIVFDYNVLALPKETYYIRKQQFEKVYHPFVVQCKVSNIPCKLFMVKSVSVYTVDDVANAYNAFASSIGDLEGMMIHSMTKAWAPGKRCWGMSRYKPQPTIDLEVESFEEAISEGGEPLGMVGRVNVRLRRRYPLGVVGKGKQVASGVFETVVGVGPGKLSHAERKDWWDRYMEYGLLCGWGKIIYAEIKYMPDESYDALRQPTIQRLRTDKKEGDILEY